MNDKIYISGRITGDPDYKEKFRHAENEIYSSLFSLNHTPAEWIDRYNRPMRFHPVNPDSFRLFGKPLNCFPWCVAMVVCLFHLVGCSNVYMLHKWQTSRGATIEYRVAKLLKKHIIHQ